MEAVPVIGGPYDGERIAQRFIGTWVYLLKDGKITTKPEYGEHRRGELYRAIKRRSLDPQIRAHGMALLYAGHEYTSCPGCRGGFVRRGGTCFFCQGGGG